MLTISRDAKGEYQLTFTDYARKPKLVPVGTERGWDQAQARLYSNDQLCMFCERNGLIGSLGKSRVTVYLENQLLPADEEGSAGDRIRCGGCGATMYRIKVAGTKLYFGSIGEAA